MRFVTLILIIALGASACGGPGTAAGSGKPTATPTSTTALVIKLRAYAKCMRAHGVDMPDPEVDSNGGVHMGVGVRGNKPKAQIKAAAKAAQTACQSLQPTAEDQAKAFATQVAKLRDLSKCLRAHGVTKFPDPAPSGEISLSKAGVDKNSSVFKAAQRACSQYIPKPANDGGSS